MAFCVLLHDSADLRRVFAYVTDHFAHDAIAPTLSLSDLDEKERDGIGVIAAAFAVEGVVLLQAKGGGAAVYNSRAVDDDISSSNGVLVITVAKLWMDRASLGIGKLGLLFMQEWDSLPSVRYFSGATESLSDLIRINSGWEDMRFIIQKGYAYQDAYTPLLFRVL